MQNRSKNKTARKIIHPISASRQFFHDLFTYWEGSIIFTVKKNCAELYKSGKRNNGVYTIDPDGRGAFDVFCDQTTAGGGWTVFQKRLDGSVDFSRGWADYKRGFGDLKGEFWLGLDKIHRLTKTKNRLRVELEDTQGKTAYAAYDVFAVSSAANKYKLSLGTYSGKHPSFKLLLEFHTAPSPRHYGFSEDTRAVDYEQSLNLLRMVEWESKSRSLPLNYPWEKWGTDRSLGHAARLASREPLSQVVLRKRKSPLYCPEIRAFRSPSSFQVLLQLLSQFGAVADYSLFCQWPTCFLSPVCCI